MPVSPDRIALCCFLNCGKPAEWYIEYGETPDDYTLSCTVHIGDMLTDAHEHRLYQWPFKPVEHHTKGHNS